MTRAPRLPAPDLRLKLSRVARKAFFRPFGWGLLFLLIHRPGHY